MYRDTTAALECRKPDMLIFEGGQKYDLVNMEEGLIEELSSFMANKTAVADLPEVYHQFEVTE